MKQALSLTAAGLGVPLLAGCSPSLVAPSTQNAAPTLADAVTTVRCGFASVNPVQPGADRRTRKPELPVAVFAGGWSLEAAESLWGREGEPRGQVLDGLTSLLDKNLVRRADLSDHNSRFVMLETIHEFAWEELESSGELEGVGERHASYLMALAEQGGVAIWLAGPGQLEWLERLENEHDNLRAALRWAAEHAAPELELRLAAALAGFWMVRGHAQEGFDRLTSVLTRGAAAAPAVRAKALVAVAYIAALQGDAPAAQLRLDEAQPLVRPTSDLELRALLLITRGFLARTTGQLADAVALFEETIALVQSAGIAPPGIMRWQLATTLMWSGDLERAKRLHQENLEVALDGGDIFGAAATLCDLGIIAFLRGELEQAAEQLREAVLLARQLGDVLVTAICLDALAATAGAKRRLRDVALLLGAAERLFARSGVAPDGVERTGRPLPMGMTVAQLMDAARLTLGDTGFGAARRAGRTLSLEAVLGQTFVGDEP